MNLTKEQIIYLAGLFDGEGSVTIVNAPSMSVKYRLQIKIANTNRELMEKLKEWIGGSLEGREDKRGLNWKICYHLHLYDKKAEEFLRAIYPYVIVKRPQIEVALELRELIVNNGERVSQENLEKRKKLKEKLNFLNKRGK